MEIREVEPSERAVPAGASELRHVPRPAGGDFTTIEVDESVVRRIIAGVMEDLKSERVQQELMDGEIAAQLKSERVQEMLKALPAWKPEGRSITRVRAFPTREAVGVFCGFVGSLAGAFSLPMIVQVEDRNVKVTLHAKRVRNRIGPVTEKVAQLAAAIG
jgi:pterin-4a-carbinolamine dehydratase